jgi:hypothetical protein
VQSRRLFRRRRITYVALAAFLFQVSISILAISKNPHTPFDEAAHFDYVVKLSKGHLPKVNEKYGQTVLEDIACQPRRGEAWLGLEPCGADFYSPKKAPFAGQSSATGYPPNYYLVTAIPYEICDRASTLKPIECGRLANSLWLSAASALLAVLMLVIGASPLMSIVVAIGFGSLPAVLLQGITVNSDAAAQALAPALALAAIYISSSRLSSRRKWGTWSLLLFIAIPTKPTIIPVAVILTYLLWDWVTEKDEPQLRRRAGLHALGSLATGVILATIWQSLQVPWRGIGGKDAMTPFLLQSFDSLLTSLQISIGASLSPFTMLTWPPLTDSKLVVASIVVSLLCWVSLFAQRKEVNGVPRSPSGLKFSSEFSVVGLLMAVIGPIVLASYAWLSYGSAPVQHRYYMATAVLLGAIGVASTSSKWLKLLVSSILGLISVMTILYLVIA